MRLDFCVACGAKENIQHHHLKPASKGGSDEEFNLITLCIQCHAIIHNRTKAFSHKQLTADALAAKKSRKERTGSIPFGFNLATDGVHLIENEAEQQILTEVKRLRGAGLGLTAIAENLALRGFVARNGKTFTATQISRIAKAA